MELAQNLGLTTVAEGIETAEQLSYLKALGCQYGQGCLFSKPLSSEAAEQLIGQSDGIALESELFGHRKGSFTSVVEE